MSEGQAIGIRRSTVIKDDPRTDLTIAKIDGYDFPRAAAVEHETALLGTLRVAYAIKGKRLTVTEYGIIEPPRGKTLAHSMIAKAAEHYDLLVRYSVFTAIAEISDDEPSIDPRDREAMRIALDENRRMWVALAAAGVPKRGSGETTAEYVTRLWLDTYKPAGRSQKELASDLGLAHITIRGYISDQTKTRKTKGSKK